MPIAIEEHDNDPGVIVPVDYLRQLELAVSRNKSFVGLHKVASQVGSDIGHVIH